MSDGTKFKVNEKRLHNLCIEWAREDALEKSGAEPQKVIWLITENNLAKMIEEEIEKKLEVKLTYTVDFVLYNPENDYSNEMRIGFYQYIQSKIMGKYGFFNILSNLNDIIVNDINKKSLFIQLKRKFFR
jgi:hypothetical protein